MVSCQTLMEPSWVHSYHCWVGIFQWKALQLGPFWDLTLGKKQFTWNGSPHQNSVLCSKLQRDWKRFPLYQFCSWREELASWYIPKCKCKRNHAFTCILSKSHISELIHMTIIIILLHIVSHHVFKKGNIISTEANNVRFSPWCFYFTHQFCSSNFETKTQQKCGHLISI